MRFFTTLRAGLCCGSALLVLAATTSGPAAAASGPLGTWINDSGRGAVEIKRCGNSLCGHIVWVKDGKDAKGCGKQIIGAAAPAGAGIWDGGWIYSPERKKTYDVELRPLSDSKLQVTGYAGVRFLSKTMIWTRAPDTLTRCDAKPVEAKAQETAPIPTPPPAPVTMVPTPPSETAKTAESKGGVSSPVTTDEPAPPAPAAAPQPAPSNAAETPPAAPSTAAAAPPQPEPAPDSAKAASPTPPDTTAEAQNPVEAGETPNTAEAGDEVEDSGPPTQKKKSRLKLSDLELDKVFTRTKSGHCKLDLPFMKVQFDCNRD